MLYNSTVILKPILPEAMEEVSLHTISFLCGGRHKQVYAIYPFYTFAFSKHDFGVLGTLWERIHLCLASDFL